MVIGAIIVWLLCGFWSYKIYKNDWLDQFGTFTTGERGFGIAVGVLGPLALLTHLIIRFCSGNRVLERRPKKFFK